MLIDLDKRSREILRHVVDAYVEVGEPVGSRTLSRRLGLSLSPATIRNVMADLEEQGLLYAPHTSAGRLPTEAGLRLFVDGILEIGAISSEERENIDSQCAASGRTLPDLLGEASSVLSGLSACAGLVLAPKTDRPLRHIEFVNLGPGRAMVVLVTEDGLVENRIVEMPLGLPPSALIVATNYFNSRLVGRTMQEARAAILADMDTQRGQLDVLSKRVVEAGLASWAGTGSTGHLIVRGQARLLGDIAGIADLERIRALFEALETKESIMKLLDAAGTAEGIQIFIGAENSLFSHTGCSLIVAPYRNGREQIVGAIGVLGPTRINYARIIPMVDYTAKVVSRLIG